MKEILAEMRDMKDATEKPGIELTVTGGVPKLSESAESFRLAVRPDRT